MATSTERKVKKIVVDSGKFATKAIGRNQDGELERVYFQTKMDSTEETITTAEGTYAIEIDGERFLIGKNATRNDSETSKKKDLHRNAMYTAIHQLSTDGDEIALVVGCPISVFMDKESREEYISFISENKEITIVVNEVRKTFKIVSVIALPESAGYIFKHVKKYKDKIIAVVDIGGLNANCCQYQVPNMLPETDFTFNLGVNVLRNSVKKKLNQKFGSNLSDKQTEDAMVSREIKVNPEKSRIAINEVFLAHTIKLRDAMIENQWDINNLEFVFVGGGSILLSEEIKVVFGDEVTISENAVWDNAEGYGFVISI